MIMAIIQLLKHIIELILMGNSRYIIDSMSVSSVELLIVVSHDFKMFSFIIWSEFEDGTIGRYVHTTQFQVRIGF